MATLPSPRAPVLLGPCCVLGVDPGLQTTGWGVLREAGSDFTATCGVVRPRRDDPTAARLRTITEGLLEVIDRFHPEIVAVERPFLKDNVRAALALGQAQAAALLAAAWRGLPVVEYAPREVKQSVTGDGGVEKSAMAEALRRQLGLAVAPAPIDAADALAVAFCHWLTLQREARWAHGR